MDDLEFKMREKGIFLKEYNDFLDLILKKEKMWKIKKKYKNIKSKIKKNGEHRENSIKIGIVGELYTIMEPFANYYTEENLIKRKIKITREVNKSSVENTTDIRLYSIVLTSSFGIFPNNFAPSVNTKSVEFVKVLFTAV